MSPTDIAGCLDGAGHKLIQRVYFEDTDFSGRVYHARYLHFMERGRSDYLRLLGVHHGELAANGLAFAVRHMAIDFLKGASIDDIITIHTAPAAVSGARMVLDQSISREREILVSATVTIVLIGAKGRPMRLPPAIRGLFSGQAASPA